MRPKVVDGKTSYLSVETSINQLDQPVKEGCQNIRIVVEVKARTVRTLVRILVRTKSIQGEDTAMDTNDTIVV